MNRFGTFYMRERTAYVNLSKTKTAETLGQLDPEQDAPIVSQIKNTLNRKTIEVLAVDILKTHNYPTIPELTSHLGDLLLKYAKGDVEALKTKVLQKPHHLSLENGKHSVADITAAYSQWLTKEFFDTIFNWNPSVFGTTMGRGEFLLGLFTQLKRAAKGGDLADGEQKIEVKGAGFRAMGQSHAGARRFAPAAIADMQKVLTTLYGSQEAVESAVPTSKLLFTSKNVSLTVMKVFWATLQNKKQEAEKLAADILKAVSNYSNEGNSSAVALMKEAISKSNEKLFLAVAAAQHLWNYMSNEKFSYLLMFNPTYDGFYILKTGDLSFEGLVKLFTEGTIKAVAYGWDTTRSSFSFAFNG